MDSIIEQVNGTSFKLIVLRKDEDTGARSVEHIFQASRVDELPVADYPNITRIVVDDKYLPSSLLEIKRKINHEIKIQYIQDCYQAVIDAEEDLKARKAELEYAINS